MSSSLEIILTSVRLSLTTEIISTSVGMIKGYMKLLEKRINQFYHLMEEMNYLVIVCISDGSSYCPHQKKNYIIIRLILATIYFLGFRDDD
jgi:hypothetical protein